GTLAVELDEVRHRYRPLTACVRSSRALRTSGRLSWIGNAPSSSVVSMLWPVITCGCARTGCGTAGTGTAPPSGASRRRRPSRCAPTRTTDRRGVPRRLHPPARGLHLAPPRFHAALQAVPVAPWQLTVLPLASR